MAAQRKTRAAADRRVTAASAAALEAASAVGPPFVCQECRKQFRVTADQGLTVRSGERHVLQPDVADMFSWIDVKHNAAAPLPRPPGGEFMLGESESLVPALPTVASILQQYAADVCGVDFPLCRECTERTLSGPEGMAVRLHRASAEADTLRRRAKQIAEAGAATTSISEEEQEAAALKAEEEELERRLQELEVEEAELRSKAAVINTEEKALSEERDEFWQEVSACCTEEEGCTEGIEALETRLSQAQDDLRQLCRTNLLNEVFHIWHDGHFGTINGLRLGRLPSQQFETNGVNAAWGNAALLLVTLARKRGLPFKRFRVHPRGANSVVEKVSAGRSGQALELWMGAPGVFAGRRHDDAIVGFCACLYELCLDCTVRNAEERVPPYLISQDGSRIGDLSVRQSSTGQTDEKWTRALKYMLLCLKWALAVTCKDAPD
eukprot:Hpha_TRINITY_DN15283_c3_g6::TRINITY_DN15283_c3_g6_i1::g.68208::m.68208/K08334/BECN, VPS30, ATG6; beclin